MLSPKEHSFYYVNGFLYMGLMAALMVGWFLLAGLAESLCYRNLFRWPVFLAPLLMLVGMAAIWWSLRFRLGNLYTRYGVGIIQEDYVELRLSHRAMTIPYEEIRHLTYREGRRGRGLILSAKGHSLYLEAPYGPVKGDPAGQEALRNFYLELRAACEGGRSTPSGEGEPFPEQPQEQQHE